MGVLVGRLQEVDSMRVSLSCKVVYNFVPLLSSDNLYYTLTDIDVGVYGLRSFTNARRYRRCKRYQGCQYYCNDFICLFIVHMHLPVYCLASKPLQHALAQKYKPQSFKNKIIVSSDLKIKQEFADSYI